MTIVIGAKYDEGYLLACDSRVSYESGECSTMPNSKLYQYGSSWVGEAGDDRVLSRFHAAMEQSPLTTPRAIRDLFMDNPDWFSGPGTKPSHTSKDDTPGAELLFLCPSGLYTIGSGPSVLGPYPSHAAVGGGSTTVLPLLDVLLGRLRSRTLHAVRRVVTTTLIKSEEYCASVRRPWRFQDVPWTY